MHFVYVVSDSSRQQVRAFESALQAVVEAAFIVFQERNTLKASQDSWKVRSGEKLIYAAPFRVVTVQQVAIED